MIKEMDNRDIKASFNYYVDQLGTKDVATALLVLAEVIAQKDFAPESLGREICLGIRKGLFGATCSDNASIDNTISQLVKE
jgi:hypothetical protein